MSSVIRVQEKRTDHDNFAREIRVSRRPQTVFATPTRCNFSVLRSENAARAVRAGGPEEKWRSLRHSTQFELS